MIHYLESKFVLVPFDKAYNNVVVICRKHYVEVILREIHVTGDTNHTPKLANALKRYYLL